MNVMNFIAMNDDDALFLGPKMGFPPRTGRTSFPWGGGQPGLGAHQRSSGRRGSGCRLAAGGGNVPDHN